MIQFFVHGIPKTAGSKRAFFRPGMKFPVITEDCKKSKDWRGDVRAAALPFTPPPGQQLLTGPLKLNLDFSMARPKGHYGSGINATTLKKKSAGAFHTCKPDVLKMARAVEDALTGVIWKDDAQIVDEHLVKNYSDRPGCLITIIEL